MAATGLAVAGLAGCGAAPVRSPWLGLDYNSSRAPGGIARFAHQGVVYDREGGLEPVAGDLAAGSSPLARALRRALAAGMVPDVEIDPRLGDGPCVENPNPRHYCLPVGRQVDAYVSGFVATATSIRRAYPRASIIFEPMNEPWSFGAPAGAPGAEAAAEYALVLRRLLVALRGARNPTLPLDSVYVPATGRLADGSSWVADLYRAEPCLAPGPGTCGPVRGWNVHPYGRADDTSSGLASLPTLRASLRSGFDNIIVSEVGFCALDVEGGTTCGKNRSDIDGTAAQTAMWTRQLLQRASAWRRAGWLRALLLWARADGGWSMELPHGQLTPQGRVLLQFARTT